MGLKTTGNNMGFRFGFCWSFGLHKWNNFMHDCYTYLIWYIHNENVLFILMLMSPMCNDRFQERNCRCGGPFVIWKRLIFSCRRQNRFLFASFFSIDFFVVFVRVFSFLVFPPLPSWRLPSAIACLSYRIHADIIVSLINTGNGVQLYKTPRTVQSELRCLEEAGLTQIMGPREGTNGCGPDSIYDQLTIYWTGCNATSQLGTFISKKENKKI